MKILSKIIIILLALSNSFVLAQQNLDLEKEQLKQVDIDFSNLSKEKGMNHAFLSYAADDGVLLRPNSYPIVGAENIKEALGDNDSSFTLTWIPLFADIAASIELGYTYGIYELTIKNADGEPKVRKGTYLSIWKKDKAGNWKFVMDTGNSGLE